MDYETVESDTWYPDKSYSIYGKAIVSQARGPPGWDKGIEPLPDGDAMKQPEREYQFDQPLSEAVGLLHVEAL